MIRGEIRAKQMAFDQGVVVMGGYRSCPAMQCRATVTTALTNQPRFFCYTDSNIHTSAYSLCSALFLVHLPPHGGLLIGGPGNGAPPPSKSSPYAIIYNPRAETKHTSKVYDAASLNDCLGELILAVIFIWIPNGCFTKLGPLQSFYFFSSIH